LRKQLVRLGYLPVTKSIPLTGTAHACGTLLAGNDPTTSVVNAEGRVHGMDNLYVVDGSVLPRSSRVNPALTIYAWALRVASRLEIGVRARWVRRLCTDKPSTTERRGAQRTQRSKERVPTARRNDETDEREHDRTGFLLCVSASSAPLRWC
jgi:hypothetical protein